MQVLKLGSKKWEESYGIFCKGIFSPGSSDTRTPFGSTLCEIAPNGSATAHSHLDHEAFLILSGRGTIEIGEEKAELEEGDVVHIPSGGTHRISNLSPVDTLKFLSTYWISAKRDETMAQSLVIPAPPTPNGPLHLGHLSGPYLAADVFARAQRGLGKQSFLAMGTDDNQCYVPAKARQLGISDTEVVGRFAPLISGVLERFGCDVAHFLHPLGDSEYTQFVQDTFASLVEKGVFEKRNAPTLFCEHTGQFVYGAQVAGLCPNCRQPTGGNGCEGCGHYNDCVDLIDPTSAGKPLTVQTVERYYFPLSKHAAKLATILDGIAMHPALRSFYQSYLAEGLPDVSVSYPAAWGIAVPGLPGQVIYEWAEMAAAYLYLSKQVSKASGTGNFWTDKANGVVQSFGIDNSFFYGFLVPAILSEATPDFQPPRAFLFNFFYQLEGKKFSTSRNHAVWGHEILENVPADVLRAYLSLSRSEDRETSFSLPALQQFAHDELVGKWESYFNSLTAQVAAANGNVVPVTSMTGVQERFWLEATRLLWNAEESYKPEQFSLRQAAKALGDAIELSSAFLHRNLHDKQNAATSLSLCVSVLQAWIAVSAPLVPKLAAEMSAQWGVESLTFQGEVARAKTPYVLKPLVSTYFSEGAAAIDQFLSRKT